MSRTLKDRPYWVQRNDPKVDRYASHDHLVTLREKVGEEQVMRNVPGKDGWHWHEEVWYTRPLFNRWVEKVPCTLHIPENGTSTWRFRVPRSLSNEERLERKNCYWNLEHYPGVRSGKEYKRLTNGALRSKVRTQLHNAVRDNGWTTDEDEWNEVDISDDGKYASRSWWDW